MRPASWLFIGFLALYLLTGGGHFYASDDVQKVAVLDALWQRGRLDFPEGWVKGVNGLYYAWFPPGASLVMLPGWLAGQLVSQLVHAVPPTFAVRFCIALENAFISAGLVTLVYGLARRLGAGAAGSAYAAIALGSATMVWPYAKTAWSEPTAALCLYLGLAALWRARAVPRWLLAAGLGFAGAIAIRQELILAVAPAIAWWMWQRRHVPRELLRELVPLCLPLVGVAAVSLAYDAARYGKLFTLPAYHLPQKKVIMSEGRFSWSLRNFYQYTLSPNQGIFWYSPAVVAGLFGLRRWVAARRDAAALLACALVPLAAFYTIGWGLSSWAWGLRYTYVFLPALLLPAAWAWRPGRRALCLALLVPGIAVQLLGVLHNPLDLYEQELLRTPGLTIQRLMTEPEHAPLRLAVAATPATLERGLALAAGHPPPDGSTRERRSGLPDLWWLLILLQPIPRWLAFGCAAGLALALALAARGFARALAREV